MKVSSIILSLIFVTTVTQAATNSSTQIEWSPNVAQGKAAFEWVDSDGIRVLKIANTESVPATINLGIVRNPTVDSAYYGVNGRVRYQDVRQTAYLEMWNHFPGVDGAPPTQHFSRTLSKSGIMKNLKGSSEWREFRLPFNNSGVEAHPNKLVINLVLPSEGTVWIDSATLKDYPSFSALMARPGEWWSQNYSAWIGGGIGTLFGCWGALIGILAQAGRGRMFIQASVVFNIVVGSACLIAGFVALAMGQPYHIWYPFILIGLLLPGIMLGTRKNLMKQLAAAEERKMAAMDAVPQ